MYNIFFGISQNSDQGKLRMFLFFPGPRLFLSCPGSLEGSQVWFIDLWNYSLVPYLVEAVREGLQIYGKRATWEVRLQFQSLCLLGRWLISHGVCVFYLKVYFVKIFYPPWPGPQYLDKGDISVDSRQPRGAPGSAFPAARGCGLRYLASCTPLPSTGLIQVRYSRREWPIGEFAYTLPQFPRCLYCKNTLYKHLLILVFQHLYSIFRSA